MFIQTKRTGYDRDGQQFAHGYFLLLMTREAPRDASVSEWLQWRKDNAHKVRGLVRYVRMGQFGNFMMARLTIKGHKLSLSGTYGADGLLKEVPQEVYDLGVDLPQELYQAWAKGYGHNGEGREGPSIRAWAKETFRARIEASKSRRANAW